MPRPRVALVVVVTGLLWISVLEVFAQPLGTFRWQLLPYCNILALNISQQGGIYTERRIAVERRKRRVRVGSGPQSKRHDRVRSDDGPAGWCTCAP